MPPVNPNTGLDPRHTLYLACSGGGKSQALMQNPAMPRSGARVFLWDPNEDHPASRYYDKTSFKAAVVAALKSGKGFRIALTINMTAKDFEWFCGIVWESLDGRIETHMIVEELAAVTDSAGKASVNFGWCLNQGRKFGLIIHAVTQFPSEISKTAYKGCPIKFIGVQEGADVRRIVTECSISEDKIRALKRLQFYRKEQGGEPELVQLPYWSEAVRKKIWAPYF